MVNGTLNLYNEVTSGNEILVNGTLNCGQNSVLNEVGSITVNDGGRLNANQTTLARSVTVNDGASMDVGGWWVNVRDLTISSGAEVTCNDIASMNLYGTLTLGDGVELDVKSLEIETSGSYYTGDNTVAIVADGTAAVKNTISLDAAFGASVSLTLQGNLTVDAITVDTNRNETEESSWGDATMTIPAGSHVKIDYINPCIYGADSDLTINVAGTLEFEESGGSSRWKVGNLVLGETAEDGTVTEGTVILRPSAKLFDDYEDTEAPVSGRITGNGTIKMYARVVPDYYEGWGWYPGLFGYNYSESEIAPLYEKGYIANTVTIWRNWNEADFSCEHEWDDGVTILEPTETRKGRILFTCSLCGTEKIEFIPATGSDEDNKPVDPVDPVPTISFTDVPEEAWFKDSVNTAVSLGLINGMGNNEFQPDTKLSRGMLVVLLYRLAGEPAVNGKNTFTDVNSGAWYETAIIWAAETGITTGFPNGTFVPDDSVTREQAAVFFHRFAKQRGYDDGTRGELSTFPDVSKVSEYAADSMAWAVKNGILSGNSINGTVCLDPRGSATRAQGAAIMVRFYNSFVK